MFHEDDAAWGWGEGAKGIVGRIERSLPIERNLPTEGVK